jgi:hypothetical protein
MIVTAKADRSLPATRSAAATFARPRRSVLQRQGQEAMNQQRRRPRAIAIARAEKSRGQNELTAYLATLALFAVTAVALFSWL